MTVCPYIAPRGGPFTTEESSGQTQKKSINARFLICLLKTEIDYSSIQQDKAAKPP